MAARVPVLPPAVVARFSASAREGYEGLLAIVIAGWLSLVFSSVMKGSTCSSSGFMTSTQLVVTMTLMCSRLTTSARSRQRMAEG